MMTFSTDIGCWSSPGQLKKG